MSDTSVQKQSTGTVALAVLSLVLIVFSCRTVGSDLWAAWQSPEYSHSIIIPLISLLLAWHCLTGARPSVKPSWWGVPVLLAGMMFLAVGILAAFEMASEYGFILALAGLCFAFFGTRVTCILAPAFIYLVFAVPLPHLVYATLSQDLQLLSSTLGVSLLDLAGIPVFQEGNIIDLGGYKLQVAEACSGLRYLFPLMSFGYLAAFLLDDKMWKRIVIFLSSIPITIGMNSLRIALVGVTVGIWGSKAAEGFLHEFEGWVIFIICSLILLAEVYILRSISGRFRFDYLGPAQGPLFSGRMITTPPVIAVVVLSILSAALFGTGIIEKRIKVIPHQPFAMFPTVIGKWHGKQQNLEPDILQNLQPSDYWLADYTRSGDISSVNFFMAYYANQRVGSSAHSPSNCIPGGGWQIASKQLKTLSMPDGTQLTVSRLLIRHGSVAQLVYYWFDERGRDITETYSAKWYLMVDSIVMQRTDGTLIRLVTPVAVSEEAAEKRLDDFLAVSYPDIKSFIPAGPQGEGNHR